ncbi:Centaurin-gamma-1A [Portunus trituberculatus]|uniref:Centaurin-gamma-1A n=1 Tax=Portunus trituberculatus TaxID=210409 RepID=A0A5B7EFR1_PORTR|nr:Centaurin-gamma-1A [Portunus trituberculatus]
MNSRHAQPYLSSSLAIRQEIQRFESVHPSIYAIYDIIELIPDPVLAQQIREHVVCIEGKPTHTSLTWLPLQDSPTCYITFPPQI